MVWLDRAGNVRQPLTAAQARGRTAMAVSVSVIVLSVLLTAAALITREVLGRRRLADWEAAWLAVGPQWSEHR
jgi:hypothetical protein